jgi:hypothetical protein
MQFWHSWLVGSLQQDSGETSAHPARYDRPSTNARHLQAEQPSEGYCALDDCDGSLKWEPNINRQQPYGTVSGNQPFGANIQSIPIETLHKVLRRTRHPNPSCAVVRGELHRLDGLQPCHAIDALIQSIERVL